MLKTGKYDVENSRVVSVKAMREAPESGWTIIYKLQ